MPTFKHAPGPYVAMKWIEPQWRISSTADGEKFAMAVTSGGNDEANATRITACLQACDGVADPADIERSDWLFWAEYSIEWHGGWCIFDDNGDIVVELGEEKSWTPEARQAVDALRGGE